MTSSKWIKNRAIFIVLIVILVAQFTVLASADINGSVVDSNGNPVTASIRVIEENREITVFQTETNGVFNVQLPPSNYTLIVYADNSETPGFDYVPTAVEVNGSFDGEITLVFGATVRFTGDLQYVDTENLPLRTTYSVQDDSGNIIHSGEFSLEFNDRMTGIYIIPELSVGDVIIPVDTVVDVNVSSNILIQSEVVTRGFIVHEVESSSVGGLISVDLWKYTIPISQSLTNTVLEKLENQLVQMNGYGFYLAKQESEHSTGVNYVEDAQTYYSGHDYSDSFDSLKKGYILITHTENELINMYRDARLSVYLLIVFLTVSSMVTGYLLFDDLRAQILSDLVILSGSLLFFYYAYPGSRTIPLQNFVLSAAVFFTALIMVGTVFPRFFSMGSRDERVHTRNLISPIFNIARRSLRRRKVRFMLTFISITLLVMSFVTLTSFSEGYGLITGKSSSHSGWSGVYIREGDWTRDQPTFILLNNADLNWLISQPETDFLSPKVENLPLRTPILNTKGQSIYGIIGVSDSEQSFVNIMETLVSGSLPDKSGVLVSRVLSEDTGLALGNTLSIGLTNYTIEGIFDDTALRQLKDLDGTPYISDRWINVSPQGETPNWVLETAEPNEILIMNSESAEGFPTLGIQRIAIELNPSFNASDFAERLALERGYLAWSNTAEAYSSYRLGNYFQGKGATLVIPWIIVVLNVVITMLNSLYERRNEIEILSSVGLNPAQVSSIFVAEASITGFIAGGLGYLVGLGFYKGLAVLNIGLMVNQKVSAVWSVASICLAISAVVAGALIALRNSIVITPSLMRRWRIDLTQGGFQEPYKIDVPIKLEHAEVDHFLDFMERKLRDLMNHPTHVTSSIKRDANNIDFIYKSVQTSTGNFYTKNTLKVFPMENGEYGAKLYSLGDTEWVHAVGSLVRRLSMDYSTEKRV